jgi:hypothetical protein
VRQAAAAAAAGAARAAAPLPRARLCRRAAPALAAPGSLPRMSIGTMSIIFNFEFIFKLFSE